MGKDDKAADSETKPDVASDEHRRDDEQETKPENPLERLDREKQRLGDPDLVAPELYRDAERFLESQIEQQAREALARGDLASIASSLKNEELTGVLPQDLAGQLKDAFPGALDDALEQHALDALATHDPATIVGALRDSQLMGGSLPSSIDRQLTAVYESVVDGSGAQPSQPANDNSGFDGAGSADSPDDRPNLFGPGVGDSAEADSPDLPGFGDGGADSLDQPYSGGGLSPDVDAAAAGLQPSPADTPAMMEPKESGPLTPPDSPSIAGFTPEPPQAQPGPAGADPLDDSGADAEMTEVPAGTLGYVWVPNEDGSQTAYDPNTGQPVPNANPPSATSGGEEKPAEEKPAEEKPAEEKPDEDEPKEGDTEYVDPDASGDTGGVGVTGSGGTPPGLLSGGGDPIDPNDDILGMAEVGGLRQPLTAGPDVDPDAVGGDTGGVGVAGSGGTPAILLAGGGDPINPDDAPGLAAIGPPQEPGVDPYASGARSEAVGLSDFEVEIASTDQLGDDALDVGFDALDVGAEESEPALELGGDGLFP